VKPKRGKLIKKMMLECRVRPLPRPRKSKTGHIYQPKENQTELLSYMRQYNNLFYKLVMICDQYYYFKKSKYTDYEYPVHNQIGDEDNLRKAVNDAMTTCGVIADDRLILGGEQYKQWSDHDYCVVKIYAVKQSPV